MLPAASKDRFGISFILWGGARLRAVGHRTPRKLLAFSVLVVTIDTAVAG